MDDVEQAEATLAKLIKKRAALSDRAKELAQSRAELAYAANTGDDKARVKLDQTINSIMRHDQDAVSVEAAITEANARLDTARRSSAIKADQEAARALAS